MKRFATMLVTLIFIHPAAAEEGKVTRVLSKDDLGKAPSGWTVAKTGKGEGSVWKVVADETAPSKRGLALAQTAEGPSALFNLCVAYDSRHKEVDMSVSFKAVAGKIDQGGGVVWRYQDADNYYVARFNPLEDNFRLYKVVAGKRIQLATKEDLTAPAGQWHVLRVVHKGDKIECFLNGEKELQRTDSTISKTGNIGLWTKADAQTRFDGLTIRDVQ